MSNILPMAIEAAFNTRCDSAKSNGGRVPLAFLVRDLGYNTSAKHPYGQSRTRTKLIDALHALASRGRWTIYVTDRSQLTDLAPAACKDPTWVLFRDTKRKDPLQPKKFALLADVLSKRYGQGRTRATITQLLVESGIHVKQGTLGRHWDRRLLLLHLNRLQDIGQWVFTYEWRDDTEGGDDTYVCFTRGSEYKGPAPNDQPAP